MENPCNTCLKYPLCINKETLGCEDFHTYFKFMVSQAIIKESNKRGVSVSKAKEEGMDTLFDKHKSGSSIFGKAWDKSQTKVSEMFPNLKGAMTTLGIKYA